MNEALAEPVPTGDSFLSAARRSARAAASAAEAEQPSRGFAWTTAAKSEPEGKEGGNRTPFVIIGLIVLIAVALIAAFVLSQGLLGSSSHPQGMGAMFPSKTAAPTPDAGTPLHAVAPDVETAPAPQTTATKPATTKPVVVPPLQQKQVNAAPVHTVPQQQPPPAQNQQAAQQPPPLNVVVPTLDHVTQLANAGNAKAQTIIGLKYLNGEGRAVNEAEAAKWLERAAQAGEPVAQYRLGTLYEHGSGVPADAAKATHWYLASAMQGNRKAMHNIAVDYAEGTGIKKDPTEAARWFSKAASLGLVGLAVQSRGALRARHRRAPEPDRRVQVVRDRGDRRRQGIQVAHRRAQHPAHPRRPRRRPACGGCLQACPPRRPLQRRAAAGRALDLAWTNSPFDPPTLKLRRAGLILLVRRSLGEGGQAQGEGLRLAEPSTLPTFPHAELVEA